MDEKSSWCNQANWRVVLAHSLALSLSLVHTHILSGQNKTKLGLCFLVTLGLNAGHVTSGKSPNLSDYGFFSGRM